MLIDPAAVGNTAREELEAASGDQIHKLLVFEDQGHDESERLHRRSPDEIFAFIDAHVLMRGPDSPTAAVKIREIRNR